MSPKDSFFPGRDNAENSLMNLLKDFPKTNRPLTHECCCFLNVSLQGKSFANLVKLYLGTPTEDLIDELQKYLKENYCKNCSSDFLLAFNSELLAIDSKWETV